MLSQHTIDRYLFAILALGRRFLVVRSVDVAAHLECSKASVSVAVKQMLQEGLISIGSHGALILSAEGRRRASAFQDQHDFFYALLVEAGVEAPVATKEACSLAGFLSASSLDSLRAYLSR